MASENRVKDGKEVLELFRAFYTAGDALHKKVVELSDASVQKGFENKRATMAALLGQLKQLQAGLNEFHHCIGHLFFGTCWDTTAVGEEFLLQELIDKLGLEMKIETINLDEPLPDHLDPEVRRQLEMFKMSQKMSRKSHLH